MATTIKRFTGQEGRSRALKQEAKIDDRIKELKSMGVSSVEGITVNNGKPRSIVRA